MRHTVALSVLAAERARPNDSPFPVMQFFTFQVAAEAVGAAFRTPPRPLHVSGIPLQYIPEIVSRWHATDPGLTGVTGPRAIAEAFAIEWTRITGTQSRTVTDQMLYRLGELAPPASVPGRPRLADPDDLPLLTGYRQGFDRDTHTRSRRSTEVVKADIAWWLDLGYGFVLWEVDGEPVSLAVARSPVLEMSRIAVVYTPPEARGHGYASAATASAARWAIDAGAEHVLLHTDLANPTSNAIYQRIGFRPVDDCVELEFTEAKVAKATDSSG
ncbi:GNAT family N-acetyltransferase [Dactylosporangium fulvum]|uniref:GNAT family N-acetyltransferase n=1 Tax=Dactylosporangium fulvum TaxID=53359 RepID=UPI0031E0C2F0